MSKVLSYADVDQNEVAPMTEKKERKKIVSMDEIADVFRWGFPTEPQQSAIWRAQKCLAHGIKPERSDNMVDQSLTWNLNDPVEPTDVVWETANESKSE